MFINYKFYVQFGFNQISNQLKAFRKKTQVIFKQVSNSSVVSEKKPAKLSMTCSDCHISCYNHRKWYCDLIQYW